VQHVYGGGEDWRATLRSVLQLDGAMDESLRLMWARNEQIAEEAKVTFRPEDFARMVIDKNFAQFLD
jgi:hypothetical protein